MRERINEATTVEQINRLIPLTPHEFQRKILKQIERELARLDALRDFQSEHPPDSL